MDHQLQSSLRCPTPDSTLVPSSAFSFSSSLTKEDRTLRAGDSAPQLTKARAATARVKEVRINMVISCFQEFEVVDALVSCKKQRPSSYWRTRKCSPDSNQNTRLKNGSISGYAWYKYLYHIRVRTCLYFKLYRALPAFFAKIFDAAGVMVPSAT
jgi:hypothetical protein